MEPRQFDRVARWLGDVTSRRSVVAGMLAATGITVIGEDADAKRKRRRNRNAGARAQAQPGLRDCPNPGPGQNLSKCDFLGDDLRESNLRGANLSGSDFELANLCGSDLRSSNLSRVDFKKANLSRVDLRGTNLSTADLSGATFCETRMPNGSIVSTGCPPLGQVCCKPGNCPPQGGRCPSGLVELKNGSCGKPCTTETDCDPRCSGGNPTCPCQCLPSTGAQGQEVKVCANINTFSGDCVQSNGICPAGQGCFGANCYSLCQPSA